MRFHARLLPCCCGSMCTSDRWLARCRCWRFKNPPLELATWSADPVSSPHERRCRHLLMTQFSVRLRRVSSVMTMPRSLPILLTARLRSPQGCGCAAAWLGLLWRLTFRTVKLLSRCWALNCPVHLWRYASSSMRRVICHTSLPCWLIVAGVAPAWEERHELRYSDSLAGVAACCLTAQRLALAMR